MKNQFLVVVGIICWICLHQSCTHEPTFSMEPDPNPMDTMVVDTMDMGNPCDSSIVYFQKDILPILVSNCALSGCHDASSATNGVVLDNYANVITTGEVEASNPDESELYKVITEEDVNKVMPPGEKLDDAQIEIIERWIAQGAEDLDCDEVEVECDTENVSYSGFVTTVFQSHCNGCHSSAEASGNVITDNYESVKEIANSGRLFGSINWDSGFSKMPQGLDQLDDCTISKIKSWIDAGAENN